MNYCVFTRFFYEDTYLDYSMLFNCHSSKDTIATIDPTDMKEFVEDVVLKILSVPDATEVPGCRLLTPTYTFPLVSAIGATARPVATVFTDDAHVSVLSSIN